MNLFKKTRGAVSVFLVIILVPCIVVSSLFVELGRTHMSKSMANSASDLALNSLLTNYDAELNEWYGMVASCQSIDEFYNVSAEFFLRTLSSQGLSEDEIFLLSDYYSSVTGDESIFELMEEDKNIVDLLQVEAKTDVSNMITPVDGANLSNATIIKDDVIEFMKYRAPIELTVDIIDKFKSDDNGITDALEAEENEPLVNSKTEFYEAEGELLAAAFNTYDAIRNYWKKADEYNLSNTELKNYQDKINGYKTAYSKIHDLTVSNLYNTDGLSVYNRVTMALDKYNADYDKSNPYVYSRSEVDTSAGETRYYVDSDRILEHLEILENNIAVFEEAKTDFNTAASSLLGTMPGSGDSQAYAIQWWVQMNDAVNSGSASHTEKVRSAATSMLKAYSRILAMETCELDDDVADDWKTNLKTDEGNNIGDLKAKVAGLQSTYLTAGVTNDSDSYLKAVKNLETYSSANENNIKSSTLKVTVDGDEKTVDNAVPYIHDELKDMRKKLSDCVKLLNIAIDGNEDDSSVEEFDKVKSLGKLSELATTYKTKLSAWKTTADVTDTTMASENETEIAGLESDMADKINAESVSELKTRLTNIRSQLKKLIEAIDSMTYGGTKLIDISNFSKFKSKTGTKVSKSDIKLKNGELKTYVNDTFSKLFAPTTSPIIKLSHTSDNNYDPRVNAYEDEVKIPELLKYFYNKFKRQSKATVTEKKKELDSGKEDGKKAAEDAKSKGRYHGGGSDITKDFSGSGTFSLAEGALDAPMKFIQSIVDGDITPIRDDLYATSYIMNMFTYATYENEGKYYLVNNKTELTLNDYDKAYNEVEGSSDKLKTWLSDDPTDAYNKSLTNKMMNKENNVAYEAEIEYILYGGRDGKGNAENVKSVYNDIYGIRYVLNLVSAFKNFWTPGRNTTATIINTIANSIATATSGIIPAPLTKVIILPILTAFETAKDLDRLEAGFPVELFKVDDDAWWIKVPDGSSAGSISGLTSIFSGPNNTKNADKGLFYSDYLTIFVYMGLSGDKAEAMYQRMAEVIQTNIKNATGAESYSLKNAHTYFRLEAELRVKPLMINIPYFSEYDNNMDTETGWCTYTISNTRGY